MNIKNSNCWCGYGMLQSDMVNTSKRVDINVLNLNSQEELIQIIDKRSVKLEVQNTVSFSSSLVLNYLSCL